MKNKICHAIEVFAYWLTCLSAGVGLGCIMCKILGEDEWSWEGWSMKHKIIYWIVETVFAVPVVIWAAASHLALAEKIDDEIDDD